MADSPLDMVAEDQDAPKGATDLKRLINLGFELDELNRTVSDLETALKAAKKTALEMATKTIPETMDEIGIAEVVLDDGRKISCTAFYSGEAKSDEQLAWLVKHGHAGIIKAEAHIPFNYGDSETKTAIEAVLKEALLDFTITQNVHAQTMKGFVREAIEAGDEIDTKLLKAFAGRKASIK